MKLAVIGGHLTPALALITSLPKDITGVYIGRKHAIEGDKALSLEYQIITALHIPFIALSTARLQRTLTKHTFQSFTKMPKGLMQAFRLLRKENPDVILSFGSYVSVPIAFAAYLLKIPIIIHEQTTQAGAANKLLAFFAKRICISWELSAKYFPKEKTVLTGNPIIHHEPTTEIDLFMKMEKRKPVIVITGGSQGSHVINTYIESLLAKLLSDFSLIHQTGDAKEFGDYDRIQKLRLTLPIELQNRYILTKFIHPFNMEYVYEKADLVISRSGANTLMTLLLLNKPSLFIPLPYGQKNEQLRNAEYGKKSGLAEILEQKNFTREIFLERIYDMIKNINQYRMRDHELFVDLHKNAANSIINIIRYVQTNQTKKN